MPRKKSEEKSLGIVFRRLRNTRGFSQEALAFHAEITSGTLARLELGQSDPSWTTIRAVAAALNVTLAELAAELEAEER